jgi:O-antigen/teichoic acid export membrane protein
MLQKLLTVIRSEYFIYLSPTIIRALVSLFVLVPVTTYFLEPDDFGIFALLMVFTLPIQAFASAGTRWVIGGNYINSDEAERGSLVFNIILYEFGLRTILMVIVALSAKTLLFLLIDTPQEGLLELFFIGLFAVWFNSLWPIVSFLMTVQRKPLYFASFAMLQLIVSVVTTITCLWGLNMGVEALFYALLATNITSFVFELVYISQYLKPKISKIWMKEIVRVSMHSIPNSIAEMISTISERIIIQAFAGLRALGIYSHSQQYQSIFKMTNGAMSNTLTPMTLSIYSKNLDTKPVAKAFESWYGILACMGAFLALFTDDIINLLTHGKFNESVPLVLVWYLLSYTVSHSIPYAQFLMAKRETRILMYTQMIPTFLGIGLLILAIYFGGIIAATFSIVFVSALIQLARYILAKRLGYRSLAEKAFIFSLLIYVLTVSFEMLIQPSLEVEVIIYFIILVVLFKYYHLPGSISAIKSI